MDSIDEIRIQNAIKFGIKTGDFVNLLRNHGDVWSEVASVYISTDSEMYSSVNVYSWVDGKITDNIIYFSSISCVHRNEDPWDFREVGIMHCKEGICGRHKGNSDRDIKFLDKFKYHGTFKIEAWLWNYRGKNCMPKKKKDLDDFAKVIGLPITGIPWDLLNDVIDKISGVVIDGWRPICHGVAEQQFKKSVRLGVR